MGNLAPQEEAVHGGPHPYLRNPRPQAPPLPLPRLLADLTLPGSPGETADSVTWIEVTGSS